MVRPFYKFALPMLLIFVLSYCIDLSANVYAGTYEDNLNVLKTIKTADGISRSEAGIISKLFFLSNISGCGFPEQPYDKDNYWISRTRIGYAGTPGALIYIDKKTGAITWNDNETTLEVLINFILK